MESIYLVFFAQSNHNRVEIAGQSLTLTLMRFAAFEGAVGVE
jgi:NADH:ubiquinone oxidoreductase subunit K